MAIVFFSHNKNRERLYQRKLLSQKSWFDSNSFPVFLPLNIGTSTRDKKSKLINKKLTYLENKWRKIEYDYFNIVKQLNHGKMRKKYVCHITLYGPEGQFTSPNLIYTRLRTKNDEARALETIGHELIHLIWGDFFEKNKTNYPETEWLVDNVILQSDLRNIFPQYKKQSVGKAKVKLLKMILS